MTIYLVISATIHVYAVDSGWKSTLANNSKFMGWKSTSAHEEIYDSSRKGKPSQKTIRWKSTLANHSKLPSFLTFLVLVAIFPVVSLQVSPPGQLAFNKIINSYDS
jgi:hypothetical protein